MTTYQGTVRWSTAARAFVVDLGDAGGTQATRRDEAEPMAREYLSLMTDEPESSITVELSDELPPAAAELIAEVADRHRRIDEERTQLARANRALVVALRGAGMTGRQVASTMHVSPQRVSQLLADGEVGLVPPS